MDLSAAVLPPAAGDGGEGPARSLAKREDAEAPSGVDEADTLAEGPGPREGVGQSGGHPDRAGIQQHPPPAGRSPPRRRAPLRRWRGTGRRRAACPMSTPPARLPPPTVFQPCSGHHNSALRPVPRGKTVRPTGESFYLGRRALRAELWGHVPD